MSLPVGPRTFDGCLCENHGIMALFRYIARDKHLSDRRGFPPTEFEDLRLSKKPLTLTPPGRDTTGTGIVGVQRISEASMWPQALSLCLGGGF